MFDTFFINVIPNNAIQGHYTAYLVVISYLVASFASYTGLSLASEYSKTAQAGLKRALLAGGALAMGCGIWSMHYIGMIAYKMNMPMHHNSLLTGLSMLIAVLIAIVFFRIVALGRLTAHTLVAASLLMGAAICGMHYLGMQAMEMNLMHTRYLPLPFMTSFFIAIAASAAAIWLFFRVEQQQTATMKTRLRTVAALAMGGAICGMHYMGMKAAVFVPEDGMCVSPLNFGGIDNNAQALAVAAVTGVILGIAMSLRLLKKGALFFQGHEAGNTFPLRIMALSLSGTAFLILLLTLEHHALRSATDDFLNETQQYIAALPGLEHAKVAELRLRHEANFAMVGILLGLPLVAVGWGFTIASLRRWQQDLVDARAAAVAASRAKSEFLANMSHDLRTPMNGILGLTRMLSEGRLLPEQAELVGAVMKSGESLLLLLNDILDFSKMEAGQLTLDEGPVHLKNAMQDIVNLLSPVASRKGIGIDYSYCDISPSCVIGDMTRIGQIVTNLLGNAIKFTDKGHVSLAIRATPDDDGQYLYEFCVSDTGVGISPAVQKTLFNKFSQGDASISRKYGGTGLGLAITRMLAEKMNGNISLESQEGVGTVVTATLKLRTATAREVMARCEMENAQQGEAASAQFSDGRVLLVDDHPVNRLFAERLLEKMGFRDITVAHDGVEALALARKGRNPFDIILMDCQMPGMDGLEATRLIREHEAATGAAATPIIAVTAHAMASDRDNCLAAGMDDYVSKPINPHTLFAAIRKHMKINVVEKAVVEKAPERARVDADSVIDLGHLSLFTDGDIEMERMMADTFLSAGFETLAALRKCVAASSAANEDWKMAAHKLKGSAGQIGAKVLASACLAAEIANGAPDAEKASMLQSIERHFAEVQSFFSMRLA